MRWVEFDEPHEYRTSHCTTLLRPGDRWRVRDAAAATLVEAGIGREVDGPHSPEPAEVGSHHRD
jgi:hypothetical protein